MKVTGRFGGSAQLSGIGFFMAVILIMIISIWFVTIDLSELPDTEYDRMNKVAKIDYEYHQYMYLAIYSHFARVRPSVTNRNLCVEGVRKEELYFLI